MERLLPAEPPKDEEWERTIEEWEDSEPHPDLTDVRDMEEK